MTIEPPDVISTSYTAGEPEPGLQALRDFVLAGLDRPELALVNVRSAREFRGELVAPDYVPGEGAQRGGHIPGAVNISWGRPSRRMAPSNRGPNCTPYMKITPLPLIKR